MPRDSSTLKVGHSKKNSSTAHIASNLQTRQFTNKRSEADSIKQEVLKGVQVLRLSIQQFIINIL